MPKSANKMKVRKNMNNYVALSNNLETLGLKRMQENIDSYLSLITDGTKSAVDVLYELTEMEM